jgi:hypothetical protein
MASARGRSSWLQGCSTMTAVGAVDLMRRDDIRARGSRNARAVLAHGAGSSLEPRAAIEAGVAAMRDAAMAREEAVRDPRERARQSAVRGFGIADL